MLRSLLVFATAVLIGGSVRADEKKPAPATYATEEDISYVADTKKATANAMSSGVPRRRVAMDATKRF